jgi:hypothetical protein
VRLNFIDITCQQPPYLIPPTHDWQVVFQDESREIASEYVGGFEKYTALKRQEKRQKLEIAQEMGFDYPNQMAAPVISHQQLPPQGNINGMYQSYAEPAPTMYASSTNSGYESHPQSVHMPAYQEQQPVQPVQPAYDQNMMIMQEPETRPYLSDPNEVLYMQVFVEEVGLWMDSMDPDKHFSRLLPFQALRQPMLKHAILACGVRHLTLVNSQYPDEQALDYYNTATQMLLKSLQDPDRDSVLCATTATILNVYEVMSEKALQRMNHIAGARALIKECRWNATTTGIGSACFWLNVGLEMFSCLHFNWGVAWDPDTWGVDMTMNPQQFASQGNTEEDWCHKMLYILAKITNFRSSVPKFQEQTAHAENIRLHTRHQQWLTLKQYCEKWDRCVPQTMNPMAYVPTYLTRSKSAFPEVWLIKRATIVARLFYHTALALLGAVHPMAPLNPQVESDVQELKLYHARQICGIVAHVKDRGVASASIRCLAIAAEFLNVRREQEEVLEIFDKIKKETGWRVTFLHEDLKKSWGWLSPGSDFDVMNGGSTSNFFQQGGAATMPPIPQQAPRQRPPSGIVNPLYKHADFTGPNPPYQGNYVAPTPGHLLHTGTAGGLYGFAGIAAM